MKTLSFTFVWAFVCIFPALAQYKPGEVLLTVNKDPVTAGEFERVYERNRNIGPKDHQTVEQYFKLFVKFKLKVEAAKAEGIDTTASFRREFRTYRDQLAKTYLTDTIELNRLMKEAYYRTENEVDVSHIMIRLPENPTAADTLKAYEQIMNIRKRLLAGEPFSKVADEVSEDPSVRNNHGNLGYFSAFRFPYSFESAAFHTKPGAISMPVRTRYGYHIIKVIDKRPSPGEVKVAHIMIAVPQNAPQSQWEIAKEKIESVDQRVKQGEDFGKLAKEYSDDRNSGRHNGELPWFGTGRMVPEFEAAAFALKKPGDVSPPVKTYFGWHIIKLIARRGVPTYDQMRDELKSKVMQDSRFALVQRSFVNHLKKIYVWKEFRNNLLCFYQLDSTLYKGKIVFSKDCTIQMPLLKIGKEFFKTEDFKKYLLSNRLSSKGFPLREFINASYDKFVDHSFVEYEDAHLSQKYPEFRYLVHEYYEGILLYDIMDKEVWNKASQDTTGLRKFFDDLPHKYYWGKRLDATVYNCSSSSIGEKAMKIVEVNAGKPVSADSMYKAVCDSSVQCLKIDHERFSRSDNAWVDSIRWTPGVTRIMKHGNRFVFVQVHTVLNPEPKTLDEVRGLVMAQYQNVLEDKWVQKLRSEFKVQVNKALLHKITLKYNNNQ